MRKRVFKCVAAAMAAVMAVTSVPLSAQAAWLSVSSILELLKTGAFTTFTLQVYFFLPFFHTILAFPVFFAFTTPLGEERWK